MIETNIAHESRKRESQTRKEKQERKANSVVSKPVYKVMNSKIIQETTVNGNCYRTYVGKATKANLEKLKEEGIKIG